jgi:hypothetical protein
MEPVMEYPCPCCGYLVFGEAPDSYAICPICFWEDDISQLRLPSMSGGANNASLIEAQRMFARRGACEERFLSYVRQPTERDAHDPGWRLIDEKLDSFEEPGSPGIAETYPEDPTVLYYWRPTFWRRGAASADDQRALPLPPMSADQFETELKRIRRRRALVNITWLGGPLVGLAFYAVTGGSEPALIVFGVVWLASFTLAVLRATLVRCPRCGRYFHGTPFLRFWFPRSCRGCGLGGAA